MFEEQINKQQTEDGWHGGHDKFARSYFEGLTDLQQPIMELLLIFSKEFPVSFTDYYPQCGSNKSIFEDDDPLIFIGFFLPSSASSPGYFLFLSCCSGISNLLFLPGITKDWLQKENLLMLYTKLDKNSVLGMDWCWIFVRTEIYSILFTGESERLKIKT